MSINVGGNFKGNANTGDGNFQSYNEGKNDDSLLVKAKDSIIGNIAWWLFITLLAFFGHLLSPGTCQQAHSQPANQAQSKEGKAHIFDTISKEKH